MKAVVLHQTGPAKSAFRIEERTVPNPDDGQALIRVAAFGLVSAFDSASPFNLYADSFDPLEPFRARNQTWGTKSNGRREIATSAWD